MTISANFPALKPSLLLDFANVERLDPRITFTRASNATYFDANGVLQTASSGVARFDHNPTTLQSLGLLIEEQRTNSCLQSENFATTWSLSAATVTTNAITAPDGANTADKLVETATTAAHYAQQTVTVTSGIAYTFSVFAKAGERTALVLLTAQSTSPFTNHAVVEFNLTNGTIISTSAGSGTITSVGNGWYRCTVTGTTTSTGEIVRCSFATVGDGTSGLFLWGAQLEAGAFATSYIPTTVAAATRNADVATMTGTNFSSWYNATEGTLYAEGSANVGPSPSFASLDDTTLNSVFRFSFEATKLRLLIVSGGVGVADFNSVAVYVATTTAKMIGAYKVNDFAASFNGAATLTDTSGNVMPTPTRLAIGSGFGSTGLNGYIRRIAYYPVRLSNDQLQALTR
jgi:hypothetical protein